MLLFAYTRKRHVCSIGQMSYFLCVESATNTELAKRARLEPPEVVPRLCGPGCSPSKGREAALHCIGVFNHRFHVFRSTTIPSNLELLLSMASSKHWSNQQKTTTTTVAGKNDYFGPRNAATSRLSPEKVVSSGQAENELEKRHVRSRGDR